MARRSLRRVMWALALGAATTVALAWAAMALPPGNAWYGPRLDEDLGVAAAGDGRLFEVTRGRSAWHRVTAYWWMQVSGYSLMIPTADFEARRLELGTLPAHLRPRALAELRMLSWYHETGWPLRAMTCSVHWKTQVSNADIIYTVQGGVQLPRDSEFNPRALPLRPLWPGFAANTAVFAGAWWLVLVGAGAARRRWRGRGGRCPSCGYSAAGLPAGAPCPECGRAPPAVTSCSG